MRRILFLAPFDVFPGVHGACLAVHRLVDHLSRNNKVALLITHLHATAGEVDLEHPNLEIHYCPRSVFDKFRVFSVLFNPHYRKCAFEIAERFQPDVIHCEILWSTGAGRRLKKKLGKPLVWFTHNVEYLKFRGSGLRHVPFLVRSIRAAEKRACAEADRVVTISPVDRELYLDTYRVPPDKICTINPCIDPDVFKHDPAEAASARRKFGVPDEAPLLTFVGNLKYEPNAVAVRLIADLVHPAVAQRYPDARTVIIGRRNEELADCERAGLSFTGFVDKRDMVNLVAASDVVLVPIDRGTGIRTKIVEAAACSRAIVSSRKGAEGLSFADREEICITPEVDDEFVACVLGLLDDSARRLELGRRARERVLAEYTVARTVQQFESLYDGVMQSSVSEGNGP